MSNAAPVLATDRLRLACQMRGEQVTGLTLEVYEGDTWHRMAVVSPLCHLIYLDGQGERREVEIVGAVLGAGERSLELNGRLEDGDGVEWHWAARFSLGDHPGQVLAEYRLEVSAPRRLLRWMGPSLLAGEGSFGAAKDEALFPGLEYLLGDEPSSDTRFAAEKYANRTVPHPYKITVPLMAVSHEGRAVGLLWDPNQDWNSAWRLPAALFSSPNRLQPGAENHWMALFAPAVEPRWLREGETEAHAPCDIQPGRPWTLTARFVVAPSGGVLAVLRAWLEAYGLPPLPDPGHDYRENVDLCVRSFLDVAWDEGAEGWHHTLADPWGPRYEAHVANLLWRYGRWPDGDPVLRARARDQVRRAVARARSQADRGAAPHLDLALVYGHVVEALDALATEANQAMAEQQPDGSWPWKPDAVHAVADFKTPERLAVMGKPGDSATGFTASQASAVLRYALCTGDPEAVAAVRHAADWCNARTRPEGAQAWELHLHVPDVLAAPYLIHLNLGMYDLTGEASYLEAANRWAWTGLPFTYLWSGYYRPIMRYGTIPVFGVTFHDVQPWFGVIVQWNGLVYADALLRLARYRPSDGPADWRHLAEGLVRNGMQQQMTYGPHLGMYPDAFSAVKGDEEYTWWLNPQLIGVNTFPLAGLPVACLTQVLRGEAGDSIHVTSGATVVRTARNTDTLRLLLRDQPGEFSFTMIGGMSGPPAEITCEGKTLASVEDVDAAEGGWQWVPTHRVALVKVRHERPVMQVEVMWPSR
ncbi:MAG: hypothetical protein GXP39_07045 [Chloroflexi bacterium]|nr:hypothetical protein [Chloroflexota bacterium]